MIEKKQIEITNTNKLDYYIFKGKQKGKSLVVTTGVHGCEYVGIQAVREIMKEIDSLSLKGQVVFLPLVNSSGFYRGLKQIVYEDGLNINREFPGTSKGSLTQKISYAIEKEIYPLADFLIDLHGGDINEEMTPLVFYPVASGDEIKKITEEAISKMTIDFKVASTASNGLYSYATKKSIPALLIERGGLGRWSRQEVDLCKKNIYEIMDFLNIIEYEKTQAPPKEAKNPNYIEAESDGFWYPQFKLGQKIKKGQVLGYLENLGGERIKEYVASTDGFILYQNISLGIRKGDSLITFAS